MSENRIEFKKAVGMIKVNKGKIHTFRSSPGMLLGADWNKAALLKAMKVDLRHRP
jgi:hypothetical protein